MTSMKVYFFPVNCSCMVIPTSWCRSKSFWLIILVLNITHIRRWLRHGWRIVYRWTFTIFRNTCKNWYTNALTIWAYPDLRHTNHLMLFYRSNLQRYTKSCLLYHSYEQLYIPNLHSVQNSSLENWHKWFIFELEFLKNTYLGGR